MMRAPVHEPRCGMCRYPVRGLPTFRCPECGNDLRMVGISVTGAGMQVSQWQRIGYWTLLFAIAAVPISILAHNVIRRPPIAFLTMTAPGDTYGIRLVITGGWIPGSREADLELGGPVQGRMKIGRTVGSSPNIAGGRRGGQRITEAVIEAWLAEHGAFRPTTKQESLDLLAIVNAGLDGKLSTRPPLYFQLRSFGNRTNRAAPHPLLIFGILAALWAAGAWVVWRRSSGA